MDLLGSILDSMEKPPSTAGKKPNASSKKERQEIQKRADEDRKKKLEFRNKIEAQIQEFVQDPSQRVLKFEAMDKLWRSVIRDVSDVAGLASYSFGEEGLDRHTVVFKTQPSEEELQALQNGEEYDPTLAQARDSTEDSTETVQDQAAGELQVKGRRSKEKFVPASADYHAKYKHILGTETGLEAARKAEPNQKFGMVPSDRKRDVRSIEETMIALRAKKKKENDGGCSS